MTAFSRCALPSLGSVMLPTMRGKEDSADMTNDLDTGVFLGSLDRDALGWVVSVPTGQSE